MDKAGKKNFQEYIDTVLTDNKNDDNVLVINHNNLLFPTKDMIDTDRIQRKGYKLVFHQCKENYFHKPYEPYLDVIKDYIGMKKQEGTQFDEEAFLDDADVYSLHKRLFHRYFEGKPAVRDEDILLGEYEYEKKKLTNSIINMLISISKEQKLLFVIAEANMGEIFHWKLIKKIIERNRENKDDDSIKIVAVNNVVAETLPYTKNIIEETLSLCEKEDVITEWAYDFEGVCVNKKILNLEFDSVMKSILDSLMMLECEKVQYYLKCIMEYADENNLTFTQNQIISLYTYDYWVNLLLENNAQALLDCNMIKNVEIEDERGKLEVLFSAQCLKCIFNIYNSDKIVSRKSLDECEEIAETLNGEKYFFRVALLKNMAEYSGWRNLWISEDDVDVDPKLIMWCKKYKFYNHLAHILVYSYNSDYRKFDKLEGIEERIKEFNEGLEIGEKLQNDFFIYEAYKKNVMLASIHGYFDVCVYFYKKCIGVVRRSGEEIVEAGIYNGLGYSSCGLGKYEDAHIYYSNALKIFYKNKDYNNVIETLYNMGINAILAESFQSASEYLIEADNILNTLKQSSLTCCNISKLYGLIALACFRNGVIYQSYIYLNNAKIFLSNILGKENERKISSSDDSMFLVYFMDALFEKASGMYEKALTCLSNAQFYMNRSTGAMFFNYPQFTIEKYEILKLLGKTSEADKVIEEGIEYCKRNGFDFYEKKMMLIREDKLMEESFDLPVQEESIRDIERWIGHEVDKKKSEELLDIINLFWGLQKTVGQMKGNVIDDISLIITIIKKKFYLEKVLFIDVNKGVGHVEYSDIDVEIDEAMINDIVYFFSNNSRKGFTVSYRNSRVQEYEEFVNMFATVGILSFVAIPCFIDDKLFAIMIAYIEMSDDWLSRRNQKILDEMDCDALSYIMENVCDAINRQRLTEEIMDANTQLQIHMKDMEDLKNLAEEANNAKSRFLANMSHEIRTPINAIIGMNEMIMREAKDDIIKEYSNDINSATKSLLSIINDILDMTKIESGKLEIIPTEYELANVINDLSHMISKRAKDKGIKFILDVNPDLPSVLYGDDIRIKQIITNLLTNAVKYTHQGEVIFKIDGTIQDDIVDLSVEVHDTGIGIKKEDLGKLFVAFERIEEERNRNIEGTGLGMNITFSLLKMMDSFLWVESEYGKGSCFSFHLNQKIVSYEKIGNFEEKRVCATDRCEYKTLLVAPKARILVVDDNEMNRKVFCALLKDTRMHIDEAESGFRCLELTKQNRYDIIFLDHMMPKMDGIETFKKIREDETNLCKKVPVIILTANAIAGAKEQYLGYGFDDYLSKPIVPEKLEKMLERMLSSELICEESERDDVIDKEEQSDIEVVENKSIDLTGIAEMDLEYARLLLKDDELIIQTVGDFYKSIGREINMLEERIKYIEVSDALDEYRIQVHALKSTSKMIGFLALSGLARSCELAAKQSDTEKIKILTPVLIDELLDVKNKLAIFDENDSDKEELMDKGYMSVLMEKIKSCAMDFDIDTLDVLNEEIKKYKYDESMQHFVDELDEQIRNFQMDLIIETADKVEGML